MATPRLCLNMIVKNESRIITRLFDTVNDIIDSYCICDTGSTDNTVELIETYMREAGKPGIVFTEPFQNFGYNRTVALEKAAEWGEYALLLDADMKLVIEPTFTKNDLTADGYRILQRNGPMEYYNVRITKTGIGVTCKGPTHEYYNFPPGRTTTNLSTLWINDIGDGGCKSDKFERDVHLLTDALKDEPENGRYHFYLANSLRDLGRNEEAAAHYKRRVEIGGWVEEVFYACYELGKLYLNKLNNPAEGVYWCLEGYNRHPKRAESLYELAKYYREKGKHHACQAILDTALKIPYPKDDVLFIRGEVYNFLLPFEQSIVAYYSKAPVNHHKYLDLIGYNSQKSLLLSNYRFYVKTLPGTDYDFSATAIKTVGGVEDNFTSSTSCIIPWGDGYMMNVRYVNYRIAPDGSYMFKHDDGKIRTLNLLRYINSDFSSAGAAPHWFDRVEHEELRYQGVEDVKLYPYCGQLLFLGTVQHPTTGQIRVGGGKYDVGSAVLESRAFDSPHDRGCEKNWCYVQNARGELRVVYEWAPLTMGTLADNKLTITSMDPHVPAFFRDLRGSSNGVRVDDEIWFLCHMVDYSTPRHYYHIIVVLDRATMKYKRNSILFKFYGDSIEYALGMVVEPTRIVFSYSRMDRTSAVRVVERDVLERDFFSVDTDTN